MTRVKQSRVNSSRNRSRVRATPQGRAWHREMVARGRGDLHHIAGDVRLRRQAPRFFHGSNPFAGLLRAERDAVPIKARLSNLFRRGGA